MTKVYSILTFLILAVIMVGCDKAEEEMGRHEYYSIDPVFDGATATYNLPKDPYTAYIEIPQEGKAFTIEGRGEKALDHTYVSMIDFSSDKKSIQLHKYESYDSEELKISYPDISGQYLIDIVVSANESTEERRISVKIADPYCSNRIEIIQPGLSAEE